MNSLTVISFNMHGFSQGFPTVRDLCKSVNPDLFLLQEHWLSPSGLDKFNKTFPDYFTFGTSAMSDAVESGVLRGRPYGGVSILVRNEWRSITRFLYSSDRCLLLKISDMLIVNVYLPCTGTEDRMLIIDDILCNIENYMYEHSSCSILIGGDLNCDLDSPSQAADLIRNFMSDHCLTRCDKLTGSAKINTYINGALGFGSCIDYFLTSCSKNVVKFEVIDDGSNLSDHLPIIVSCHCDNAVIGNSQDRSKASRPHQFYLRWDRADINAYYSLTGHHLQMILDEFRAFESIYQSLSCSEIITFIDHIYNNIVCILRDSAKAAVPSRRKSFYKFWWDQDLDCLKEDSVASHKVWKAAGKPRTGPIFDKFHRCKLLYKKRIRERERLETSSYTNDLHEALIKKQGTAFWKIWRSKFDSTSKNICQVNGVTNDHEILDLFQQHFANLCSETSTNQGSALKDKYVKMRPNYSGLPFDDEFLFDVELVDRSIRSLSKGKAAGLDGLTSEHLHNCHPSLFVLLYKLFNFMIKFGHVPEGFGLSYTIPLPKSNYSVLNKSLSVDDFRGISISAVLSKVFEKCIFDRYQQFFQSSDNQFGFKKGIGCSHAIHTVKSVVNHFVNQGSTVNICALDLRKAFDKLNHYGLFIKLMDRMLPVQALCTIEYWFSVCYTSVRWNDKLSTFFPLKCGVRQGGILSPYFFALYIDGLVKTVQDCGLGCQIGIIGVSIFLYADDIILLAPSVSALQKLLATTETYLSQLQMSLNAKKSVCMRIGKSFREDCCVMYSLDGESLSWVDSIRYLGVHIVSGKKFACSYKANKKSFYRSFNSIMCKVGSCASEEVLLNLLSSKCLPVLMYGLDVCPLTLRQERSLDFISTRVLMKIFRTGSVDIINECRRMFGLQTFSSIARGKINRFSSSIVICENLYVQIFSFLPTVCK